VSGKGSNSNPQMTNKSAENCRGEPDFLQGMTAPEEQMHLAGRIRFLYLLAYYFRLFLRRVLAGQFIFRHYYSQLA
jgi:hypothetical protein